MKYIDEAAKYDDFQATFWELEIEGFPESKFRIEECSLPFIKFQTETLVSGEKFYTDIEYPGEFSITIREMNDMSVRKAFKAWMDEIYVDGTFQAYAGVEIGSEQDKIHKRMFLRLLRHEKSSSKKTVTIEQKQVFTRLTGGERKRHQIVNKEIIDNVLFSLARRKVRNATAFGSEAIPDKISSKYSQSGTKPELPTRRDLKFIKTPVPKGANRKVERIQVNKIEEKVIRTFEFENTKLLGFDPITFNYTSGEPLKYSISLIADYINETEEN